MIYFLKGPGRDPAAIDWALVVYFAFVLEDRGVAEALHVRQYGLLPLGCAISAWITRLALIFANLGAQGG